LDIGCRAQDFLDLNIDDINLITREIHILKGKGKKPRSVSIGNKSSKAIRRYLKHRKDYDNALWVRDDGREG